MKVLATRILNYNLNNGKDAQHVKYLYKNHKDVIIWFVDVNISFVLFAYLIGITAITNAYKAWIIGYFLTKLNKCLRGLHF